MPHSTGVVIFWYIFPIALLLVSTLLIKKTRLDQTYGLKSPDVVTPFLFISIHYISKDVLEESFLPYIFLMIFLVGMLVAVFQAYQFKEIKYRRYFKMMWRLIFLITLLVYLLLMIMSIILQLR